MRDYDMIEYLTEAERGFMVTAIDALKTIGADERDINDFIVTMISTLLSDHK